jgi:hypothetical protein
MPVPRKGPRGIVLMFLLPPPDDSRVALVRARDLGQRLAGLDLAHHWQRELTGQLTSFESQGCCLLSYSKGSFTPCLRQGVQSSITINYYCRFYFHMNVIITVIREEYLLKCPNV